MPTQIIETYGIDFQINGGEINPLFLPPAENKNHLNQEEPPRNFIWDDAIARLVGGPEPLIGQWMKGAVFLDTRTIVTDSFGAVISDTVARTWPAYTLNEMTITTNLDIDWTDTTNPNKPRQRAGPILYRIVPTAFDPEPIAVGGQQYCRVGVKNNRVLAAGFVMNEADLKDAPDYGEDTFYTALDTGMGYVWADGDDGVGGLGWRKIGATKNPVEIIQEPFDSVDDLPNGQLDDEGNLAEGQEEAPEIGTWAIVNGRGAQRNQRFVYERTISPPDGARNTGGWRNIGPVNSRMGVMYTIPEEWRKYYTSGYIYPLVFNRCNFKYVPRLSGGTQDTYEGEIDIIQTGWFPTEPYDEDENIYPMDSVTKFKPDDRESVAAVYTVTMNTNLVTWTAEIIQDVYQPTSNWGGLLNELLGICYFTNGIYH